MKRLLLIALGLAFHSYMYAQCTPSAAPDDEISNAIAKVSYNGKTYTGALINNGNDNYDFYYFITSMIPFHSSCGSGANNNTHISNITFTWQNGQTTSGATVLSSSTFDEFVAILRLDDQPPLDEISYLGLNMGGIGQYLFGIP